MRTLTDASWALLRDALPFFASRWREYTATPGYDPRNVGMSIIEFGLHLGRAMSADPAILVPVFSAMDRLCMEADEDLRELLDGAVRPGLVAWRRLSSGSHDARAIATVEALPPIPPQPPRLQLTL